ncbi:B12-binding domain-containing radical SAM protein [Tepidibacter mesophilus]|uniref:B12-binding domain-containing radical SAM protein n=1 Tax=Tepidibacter mesophilus TaxID=655607 RepID=UPI000C069E3D|nr:radical SAM protein [Tepidibacter mesophilus]
MNEFDIILVNPLMRFGNNVDNVVEYLGFGYLASFLRGKGLKVKIIDMYIEDLKVDDIVNRLENTHFKLLGFTAMSSIYSDNICNIIDKLSKDKMEYIHITVGGHYTNEIKEDLLKRNNRINSIIIGEGEKTLFELIECIEKQEDFSSIKGLIYRDGNKIIENQPRPLMTCEELEECPLPDRDTTQLVLENNGYAQVLASRGCFGNCSFCAVNSYYTSLDGEKWRYQSVNKVIHDIEYLKKHFDIKYIDFADEEFIGPPKQRQRVVDFANELIKRNLDIKFMIFSRTTSIDKELFKKLKLAGLDRVFLGIEFGSNSLLKFYRKGVTVSENIRAIKILKDLDIKFSVGFIMFEPLIDIKTFRENLDFYMHNCSFKLDKLTSKLAIYPNTKAYTDFINEIEIYDKEWDIVLGDHYPYKFKCSKIEYLYSVIEKAVTRLSKSEKYRYIKEYSRQDKNLYNELFTEWKQGVFYLIDGLAKKIDEESVLTNEKKIFYEKEFMDELILWDKSPVYYNKC